MEKVKLLKGDNRELLKTLEDNSIDSVITDPPYALTSIKNRFGKPGSAEAQYGTDGAFQRASKGFMGKEWDSEVPSVEVWKEVLRVLKPGGHVLAFGGTRTYHHLVMNMELAGFEIRDSISYMYGSGFPKSHNIGKAVDKLNGNEREVVGEMRAGQTAMGQGSGWNKHENRTEIEITKGQSEWEGWGTALKPSMELICLARKPLTEKSIAENVLKHGTGGINIDDCRVKIDGEDDRSAGKRTCNIFDEIKVSGGIDSPEYIPSPEGRFPANTILECICDEPHTNHECPCYILDKQSKGSSRFFYTAKVSKKERNMGLDGFEEKSSAWLSPDSRTNKDNYERTSPGMERFRPQPRANNHPTVKPINLMTYLCRLITPPNGVILDMYMGSGSTGISALIEGFNFIGMEMDEDYFNIAEARINNYEKYRQFKK
jgi:site-specific DNA-methyltransferase (adenine-specific)